jgi:hypothetical protein
MRRRAFLWMATACLALTQVGCTLRVENSSLLDSPVNLTFTPASVLGPTASVPGGDIQDFLFIGDFSQVTVDGVNPNTGASDSITVPLAPGQTTVIEWNGVGFSQN